MTIQQIYEKYNIMPTLQLHMLRVAGVALLICENLPDNIDAESIVHACLLHDMGNIIKSNLDLYPNDIKPSVEYWKEVKEEFIKNYGTNETEATRQILNKLKVDNKILELFESIGFSNSKKVFGSKFLDGMICNYSDQRVAFRGVMSLDERISEGRVRYLNRKHFGSEEQRASAEVKFEETKNILEQMEVIIFSKTKIRPEDINDESINSHIESLRGTEIV